MYYFMERVSAFIRLQYLTQKGYVIAFS